jgi:hypothetical protein
MYGRMFDPYLILIIRNNSIWYNSFLFFLFLYCFDGLGFEFKAALAKKVLYHLNHTSSHFEVDWMDLTNYLPRLTSSHDPPDLNFPSS